MGLPLAARVKFPFTFSFIDYPDKENMCVSIYFMGCTNMCESCHNPEFANPKFDENVKVFKLNKFVEVVKESSARSRNNKVSLLGGDPLSKYNIQFTKEFLTRCKDKLDICIYTGHPLKYVKDNKINGFRFLKCGKFEKNKQIMPLKNEKFMSFASSNQILYDSDFNQLSRSGVYYF